MSIARYQGVDRYVGNTPLIRLRRLSELTGCEILGKAEFMNPGGSVKDRAAYGIITDAEQRGLLKPGATITDGTLAGASLYLKEQNPNVAAVCPDPYGAAMWSWFTNGNTDTNDGDSIAEGIGQGRVTKNIEVITVDKAHRIDDQTALTIVYQLLREEGLFLGLSSGINVAGAVRFAKERGRGQTLVTLLCDSGHKYQSTLYNREWLATKNLDPDLPLESVFG